MKGIKFALCFTITIRSISRAPRSKYPQVLSNSKIIDVLNYKMYTGISDKHGN